MDIDIQKTATEILGKDELLKGFAETTNVSMDIAKELLKNISEDSKVAEDIKNYRNSDEYPESLKVFRDGMEAQKKNSNTEWLKVSVATIFATIAGIAFGSLFNKRD